jgi:hypothetical protein
MPAIALNKILFAHRFPFNGWSRISPFGSRHIGGSVQSSLTAMNLEANCGGMCGISSGVTKYRIEPRYHRVDQFSKSAVTPNNSEM